MTKNVVPKILHAAVRVDDSTAVVHGHGVDRQVTPLEVLLERHAGICVKYKPMVAAGGFSLSTGERIFLMRLRVKKYREVRADGGEALFKHFLGRGAHDDPVTVSACGHVMARLTKKHVTHVSADGINLHKLKLVRSENPDQGRSASLAVGSEGVTVPTNDLKEPRSSFSR